MKQITIELLKGLIAAGHPPCVSLYQPTHRRHPDSLQDPVRYRNLLTEMEKALVAKYPVRQVRPILENFQQLAQDSRFWKHRSDGLAIFGSTDRFEVLELQRPIPERLVIADSFHTKPLMRILQSGDRFQVLCLSRSEAKLYEGNRDVLDPVELTQFPTTMTAALGNQLTEPHFMVGSYGVKGGGSAGGTAGFHGYGSTSDEIEIDMIRFFRVVDRGILEFHSRPSGLPLMLAALAEHHAPFRSISQNPYLLGVGIEVNPDALSVDELRTEAWERMKPLYLARLAGIKDRFEATRARHAGTADLSDAAKAAVAGRIATLLVDADQVIPGRINRITGDVQPYESASGHGDDMLDDLAEIVLTTGGDVVVVPREQMPTDSGLAAIYRY